MTFNGIIQIALFCAIIVALTRPLGGFMTRVFGGERNWLSPLFVPVERLLYGAAGVDPKREQNWRQYGVAMLPVQSRGGVAALFDASPAAVSAAQSAAFRPIVARSGAEYGDELRHQYELAGV